MKRRQFAATVGAAAAALAGVTLSRAQSNKRLGYLYPGSDAEALDWWQPIGRELAAFGFVERRNLTVVMAAAREARLPEVADDLVRKGVDAILTVSTQATRLLMGATQSIPIVTGVGDPVASGFARSVSRPGGNITGLSWGSVEDAAKQLDVMRALLPQLARVQFVADAANRAAWEILAPSERAARTAGIDPAVRMVRSPAELQSLIREVGGRRKEAIFINDYASLKAEDRESFALVSTAAIRARVALFSRFFVWTQSGGLASTLLGHRNYGKALASLIANVLRGAKPGDMPFVTPDTADLALNVKTAAALGLKVPDQLLLSATEVIR